MSCVVYGILACFLLSFSCGSTICCNSRNSNNSEDEVPIIRDPKPKRDDSGDDHIYQSLTISSSDDVVDKNSECVICLQDFSEKLPVTLVGCGHYYHKKCYEAWKKVKGKSVTCACCRAKIAS